MTRMMTNVPARKVAASSVGSALSVLGVWALHEFAGVEMPASVQSALVLCVTFLVGYYVPPARRDQVVAEEGA